MPMAKTLGLRFTHVERGRVELEIPVTEPFTFRPGQLQATPVFAVSEDGQESLCATLLGTARNIDMTWPV